MHLDGLEARILARLLSNACPNEASDGGTCVGGLANLCEDHRQKAERQALRRVVLRQLDAPAAREGSHPGSATAPPCRDADEARTRLQAILDRRRFVPNPHEAYTIPFESLRFERRKAFGPSLVEGDEDVAFWFFEKSGGEVVVSYGTRGSKSGKDMPLASRRLFHEIMQLLKFLPGYTETCEITGEPIRQPLGTLAYKLLRGAITIDHVRFVRFSKAAASALRAKEAREQLPGARKLLRLSPVELASALAEQGLLGKRLSQAISNLVDLDPEDVRKIVAAATDKHSESDTASRSRASTRPALLSSPLFRYGHAVIRRNSAAAPMPLSGDSR